MASCSERLRACGNGLRKGGELMRDDAKYVVHPNGAEAGYIPFIVHEKLAWQDRRTIKRLTCIIGALVLALIAAIIIR